MGAMQQMLLASGGSRVKASVVIASNTLDFVLNTSVVTGYVAGSTDVTLTVASGYYMGASSTGSAALTVNTSFSAGDTVTVVVESGAFILGMGGAGGLGGSYPYTNGVAGGSGGPALYVQRTTTVTNNGTIGGGGGGGGGGGAGYYNSGGKGGSTYYNGDGGGGGQGYYGGAGGAAPPIGSATFSSAPGNAGNATSPGAGGYNSNFYGGTGGSLGADGNVGGNGSPSSTPTASPGTGGSAGLALIGKSFVNSGSGISGTVYGAQT